MLEHPVGVLILMGLALFALYGFGHFIAGMCMAVAGRDEKPFKGLQVYDGSRAPNCTFPKCDCDTAIDGRCEREPMSRNSLLGLGS